jgi:hypothetical protein
MAEAISPEAGSMLFSPTAIDLLSKAIGGTSDQDVTKTGTTTGTQAQTGTTTGTNRQVTDQTTQSTADVEALKQVFAQQQGGITPQMLAAIFAEGQKAAPQLVASTANAVGARAGNNTPLATALTALNAQLTSKAAELDLSQKNASADTAAKIAQLTGGTKTTGTQTGETGQSSNQTSTNNSSSNEKTNNQVDTQPNYGNVGNLIGLLLGGSALNTGLKDFGGISGAVGQGTNAIGGLLQQLLGGLVQKPSQDFLGQAGTQAGTGTSIPGNVFGTPAAQVDPANSLVPSGFLGGGNSDLNSLLGGLGLGAQSSESDFWKAIGLDPTSLSFGSPAVEAGTTDLSSEDWFNGEGWNTLDWGG